MSPASLTGYITRAEVARLLGIKRSSVYAQERRGLLPPAIHVTGALCIYPEDAVRSLVEGRTAAALKAAPAKTREQGGEK